MIFIAVLLLAASAYGQGNQKCLHSNQDLLTADNVIAKVLVDLDTNGDQIVTDLELLIEIVGKFDANKDSSISPDEFVSKWHIMYKDVPDFAQYLFCHFDMNGDETLSLNDVPALKARVDLDGDNIITNVEFTIFMTKLYRDCVPHSHLDTTNGYC